MLRHYHDTLWLVCADVSVVGDLDRRWLHTGCKHGRGSERREPWVTDKKSFGRRDSGDECQWKKEKRKQPVLFSGHWAECIQFFSCASRMAIWTRLRWGDWFRRGGQFKWDVLVNMCWWAGHADIQVQPFRGRRKLVKCSSSCTLIEWMGRTVTVKGEGISPKRIPKKIVLEL